LPASFLDVRGDSIAFFQPSDSAADDPLPMNLRLKVRQESVKGEFIVHVRN
jgi:hypothetical protein